MKLNKITCLAAAAIMSISAVSASAATLPYTANNNEAFTLCESLYYDGLYYEAREALGKVDPNGAYYDANKVEAWKGKINYAIARWEIKSLLKNVQKLHDAGLYYEAQAVINTLNARGDLTQDDFYSILWWEDVVADKIAALENKKKVVVCTEASAINRVKASGYALASNYEWFSPVKVANGYHVYVKTQLPGGGSKDVAAFRVYTDGTVERAF